MTTKYIGTSGWSYKQWENGAIPTRKNFYTGKSNFAEYVNHFNMVELNCTFYKQPSEKTVAKWKRDAPKDFKYIVKVNKYLTHAKKLTDWEELFDEFHSVCSGLGEHLLGYLIQLPPQMTIKQLAKVLKMAKYNKETFPNVDFYVEFRHSSWFCSDVYKKLAGLVNIVIVNQYGVSDKLESGFSPKLEDVGLLGNNKNFFRCHGTWCSQPYCGNYSDEDLALIASLDPVIVTFDNTDSFTGQLEVHIPGKMAFRTEMGLILPSAITDAKRLKEMME